MNLGSASYRHVLSQSSIKRTQVVDRIHCQLQSPGPSPNHNRNYVWISDDVLQQALSRYAAVSRSWRIYRRSGSSVPGPLEARKRLAKRRMAVTSLPATNELDFLSSLRADITTWFKGSQQSKGLQPWNNLQWLPPQALERTSTVKSTEMLEPAAVSSVLSLVIHGTISNNAGEHMMQADLLTALAASPQAQEQDHAPSHDANVAVTGQLRAVTVRKIASQSQIRTRVSTWQAHVHRRDMDLCQTIEHVYKLFETRPSGSLVHKEEALMTLTHLLGKALYRPHAQPTAMQQRSAINRWKAFLEHTLIKCFAALGSKSAYAETEMLTSQLLHHSKSRAHAATLLPTWFSALRKVDAQARPSLNLQGAALRGLRNSDSALGTRDLYEFASFFAHFGPLALGRVLLLSAFLHVDRRRDPSSYLLRQYSRRIESVGHSCFPDVAVALFRFVDKFFSETELRMRLWSWTLVFQHSLFGERGITKLLRVLDTDAVRYDPAAITRLVTYLARSQPQAAISLLRKHRVPLLRPHKIVANLINGGVTSSHNIFFVLWHCEPTNKVLTTAADGQTRTLTERRINLVAEVAPLFATQSTVTSRQAFRNAHVCYKYLKDHGARIPASVAGALVTAGITRPLQNREWVSTVKSSWISKVVTEVEGPEAAAKLDTLAFQWREQVRMHRSKEKTRIYRRGMKLVSKRRTVIVPNTRFGLTVEGRWCWARSRGKRRMQHYSQSVLEWTPRYQATS